MRRRRDPAGCAEGAFASWPPPAAGDQGVLTSPLLFTRLSYGRKLVLSTSRVRACARGVHLAAVDQWI